VKYYALALQELAGLLEVFRDHILFKINGCLLDKIRPYEKIVSFVVIID